MATTAVVVGTGSLLSKSSYHAMTDPNLLGFGHPDPICAPSCFTQIDAYNFGLGVVRAGPWIFQDPELSGFSATEAYLPTEKISVSVAVTYLPAAFDAQGDYANSADALVRSIGGVVAPKDPPPTVPGAESPGALKVVPSRGVTAGPRPVPAPACSARRLTTARRNCGSERPAVGPALRCAGRGQRSARHRRW